MKRLRNKPGEKEIAVKDDNLKEILKDIGFKFIATLGWIAWIPTAILIFIIFGIILTAIGWIFKKILNIIFAPLANTISGAAFCDMVASFLSLFIVFAFVVLGWLNIHFDVDPKSLDPWNVPWMILMSIFSLIVPNRFTFFYG